ncbi:MAG: TonB-dependent receptor [Bacteroidia bacterium]|nr:TonB-dependent receptor [Bacteroidia bacterium]
MKKKLKDREVLSGNFLRQLFFIMKLTLFFLMTSALGLFATRSYSQNTRVTLDLKSVTVKEALKAIENTSEFFFIYNNELINVDRKIDINVKDQKISDILSKLFDGENVEITVIDRKIVLAPVFMGEQQPTKKITGKVTDQSGASLPGVTVMVKGTTNGSITDANGKYSLANIPENGTLKFSFVGMRTQEIAIGNKTSINVSLADESIGLDEVVAVGYGTVKKQNLTGSVSRITSDALQERAITTLGEGFVGKLAGVYASQPKGGAPGAELNIKIRGIHSIDASNNPLYVIDGIPTSNMQDFNPNDVASIEVLKDASSGAIYGARGAGGVVLITTKTGKIGKPTFNLNVSQGFQQVEKYMDVMNRDTWLAWITWARNQAWLDEGGSMKDPMSARGQYMQIPIAWLTPESLPDNDWQRAVLQNAPLQNYQLTASGGGDMGTFLISGSYMDQDGLEIATKYKRATFRLNTTLNVGQHLKLGMNIAPSYSTSNLAGQNIQGVNTTMINMPPIVPWKSQTQEWGYAPGTGSNGRNPIETLKQSIQENKNNKILTNVWGELSLSKSLSFKSQYSYDFQEARSTNFLPANLNKGANPTGSVSSSADYRWSLQNTLSYSPKFSTLFDLNLLLGQSVEEAKNYFVKATATGFPNDLVYTLNVASTPVAASGYSGTTSYESKNSMFSLFGRLTLSAKDKYLLTANIRRDGSSKFGSDKKWGWFPSASIGWKINREEFMKSAGWIDLLKLRLLYGKAGNDNIGDYESIALLGISNYNLNGAVVNGLAPTTFSNADLGWETKISKGIGLDLIILKNKLEANLDYYIDDTKDMLLNAPLPGISGYTSVRQNLGAVQNRGWEFELTSHNLEGRLSWTTSFNISRNVNEVKKLGIDNAPIITYYAGASTNITMVGEPIGSYYMYKTNGLLLDKDFDSSGKALVPIAAGQLKGNIKGVDINGDGKITTADYTIVGNNQPDFFWGLTNRFSYKNFDMSILLQGSQGGKIFFAGARHMDEGDNWDSGFNLLSHWARQWKPPVTPGENPYPQNTKVDLSWDGVTPYAVGNNLHHNDTWVYDASYIRINNITIGYNLPKDLCQRVGIGQARIYIMGDNIYSRNHYPGMTPESNTYGNQTTNQGIDYGTYPVARKYSVGINVTF